LYACITTGWAAAKAGTLAYAAAVKAVVKASISALKAFATKAVISISTKVLAFLNNPVVGAILTLVDVVLFGLDMYNMIKDNKWRFRIENGKQVYDAGFIDSKTGYFIRYDDYDKVFSVDDYSNVQFEDASGEIVQDAVIEGPIYTRTTQGSYTILNMHIVQLAAATKDAFQKVLEQARLLTAYSERFKVPLQPLEDVITNWRYQEAALGNDEEYISFVIETLCVAMVNMVVLYGPLGAPEFQQLPLFLEGDQLLNMGLVQLCTISANWLTNVNETFSQMKDNLDEFGIVWYGMRDAGDFIEPHGVNWQFYVIYQNNIASGMLEDKMFDDTAFFLTLLNDMLRAVRESIGHYKPKFSSFHLTSLQICLAELQPIQTFDIREINYKTSTLLTLSRLYYDYNSTSTNVENILQMLNSEYSSMVYYDGQVNELKVSMGEAATPTPAELSLNYAPTAATLQPYVTNVENVLINTRNFAREVGISVPFETNVVFTKQYALTDISAFISNLLKDIKNVQSLQLAILTQGEADKKQLADNMEIFSSALLILQTTMQQFYIRVPEIDLSLAQFSLADVAAFPSVSEYMSFTEQCINLYIELTNLCEKYSIEPKAIELLNPNEDLSNKVLLTEALANQCYMLASFLRHFSQNFRTVELSQQVMPTLVEEITKFNTTLAQVPDPGTMVSVPLPTAAEMTTGIYNMEAAVQVMNNGQYLATVIGASEDTSALSALIDEFVTATSPLEILVSTVKILRDSNNFLYLIVVQNSGELINTLVQSYLTKAQSYNTLGDLFEVKSNVFKKVYSNFPVWYSIASSLPYSQSQAAGQDAYLKNLDEEFAKLPFYEGAGDIVGRQDYDAYYEAIVARREQFTNATDTGIVPDEMTSSIASFWNNSNTFVDNVRKIIRLNDCVNFMGIMIATMMIEQRVSTYTFPAYMFQKQFIPPGIDDEQIDWATSGPYLKILLESIEANLAQIIPAVQAIGQDQAEKWDALRLMGYRATPFGYVPVSQRGVFENEQPTTWLLTERAKQQAKYEEFNQRAIADIRTKISTTKTSIWGAGQINTTQYSEGLFNETYYNIIRENLEKQNLQSVIQYAAQGLLDVQAQWALKTPTV
jgi:hypothetical protein